MGRLYGESRIEVARRLERTFEEAHATNASRWVSLEAPSGWGKTTIARDLFRRLAARQPDPRYWPDEIVDATLGRKATNPLHVVPAPGAVPSFLWFGLRCPRENESGASVSAEMSGLLRTHGEFLRPYSGGFENRRPESQGRGARVEHFFATALSVAAARIPVVLLVEDIHYARPLVLEGIDRALSSRGPCLVISTARPAALSRSERLTNLLTAYTETGVCQRMGLVPLEHEARALMVHDNFSVADPEAAAIVCDTYVDPYELEQFCEHYKRQMADDGTHAPDELSLEGLQGVTAKAGGRLPRLRRHRR